jgi:hypothetical protein
VLRRVPLHARTSSATASSSAGRCSGVAPHNTIRSATKLAHATTNALNANHMLSSSSQVANKPQVKPSPGRPRHSPPEPIAL